MRIATRPGAFVLLALCASGLAHAQVTITNGTATFARPGTSSFDTSPTANFTGVSAAAATDHVFETGWWFRVAGDTQETVFPVPTTINATGNSSTLDWTDVGARGLFDAREVSQITAATPGPGGQVRMAMTITNRSASTPLTINVFHQIDLDMGGTAAGDTTVQPTPGVLLLRVTDATAPDIGEYTGLGADNFLVRPFSATTDVAGVLSDTAVTNFDNTTVPLNAADMTGGFQWAARTIPPSGSITVTAVFAVNSPIGLANADLSITKTDGVTQVLPGGSTTYTITASNAGPTAVTGATVTDTFPAACAAVSWTCVGAGGGSCGASGTGNINQLVNLPVGATTTHTAICTLGGTAAGTLANTATVTAPASVTDPTPGNNTATDTNTIVSTLAPVFGYTPPAGGTVGFTGGTAVGTTATASIAVAIATPGVGTGAAATTTTTCAVPAGFTGFGQTVTAVGNAASTTGGPLAGSCVLGAAAVTATMNCNEVQGGVPARGPGGTVVRTFTLSCPAGAAAPLTSLPITGSLITLPVQSLGGGSTSAPIVFSNPGLAAATVTCTAPAAPFSVNPISVNVPAGGSATVTVSYGSATLGSATGVLNCAAGAQAFTFNLAGNTAQVTSVPVLGGAARVLLLLAMLAIGGLALVAQRRA